MDKFLDEYRTRDSRSQKKMMAILGEELQNGISSKLRIIKSPPRSHSPSLTAEESLKFKMDGNFTDRQYQQIRNAAPSRFASLHALENAGKKVTDLVKQHSEQINGVHLKYFKIEDALKYRLDLIDDEDVYAVITFDYGKGSSKISLYLVCDSIINAKLVHSPENYFVLAQWNAKEEFDLVSTVFTRVFGEYGSVQMFDMSSPQIIGEKAVEFAFAGDLKAICQVLGLQGGSATHFCHLCEVKREEMNMDIRNLGPLRTLQSIEQDFERSGGIKKNFKE